MKKVALLKNIKNSKFISLRKLNVVDECNYPILSLIELFTFLNFLNRNQKIENDSISNHRLYYDTSLDMEVYHNTEDTCYVDYDNDLGIRFNCFSRYDSKKMTCDERVLLEAFLIKFRTFGFKMFYCSFQKIEDELGIKKDRARTIVKKFKQMNIFQTIVKTSSDKVTGCARQITYYKINKKKLSEIYPTLLLKGYDEEGKEYIKKYLNAKS